MAVYKTPLLTKHPPLPVFQITTDISLFHLVIIDKQGPKPCCSLGSLPPPLLDGPSCKTHYPIQSSCCTLNPRVSLTVCAPINLSSLHMVQSLFGSSLHNEDCASPPEHPVCLVYPVSFLNLQLPPVRLSNNQE
jgi:hypothetical protein